MEERPIVQKKTFVLSRPVVASAVLAAVIVASAAAYLVWGRPPSAPPAENPPAVGTQESGAWSLDLERKPFASVTETRAAVTPSVPPAKVAVSEIENLAAMRAEGVNLTARQASAIEDEGFFLAENKITGTEPSLNDYTDLYSRFGGDASPYRRQADDAVFITSDFALHLYHVLVDRSFQAIEKEKFQPRLRDMTRALFHDSLDKYNRAPDPALKDSYKRLASFYLIPLVVLDAGSREAEALKPNDFDTFAKYQEAVERQEAALAEGKLAFALTEPSYDGETLPGEVYATAKAELELIQAAKGMKPSPLFSPLRPEFINDYSQFRPRSHYTNGDVLRSYFISMMWYGRMGFPLSSPDLTRDALLITGQVNNLKVGEQRLADMWSDMASVIDFFVGEVDDLTAFQYTGVVADTYGRNATPEDFVDAQLLDAFVAKAKKDLPNPRIVSEAVALFDDGGERDALLAELKQFRFMGQRFTPDAYVINNLTQGVGAPEPETQQMLPTMPTSLMVMRVVAPENMTVKDYLDRWVNDSVRIKEQGRQSDKVIAKVLGRLDGEFAAYGADTWSQNMYWRWLDAFRVLLRGYGEGYPLFMQGDAWQKKNLGAAMGSFTELKHDTLLYAKQSYAELGGGPGDEGEMPPVPKGYVEPDLVFWDRIIDLAEVTKAGLTDRGVFPEAYGYKYDVFVDASKFFRRLAEQELANEAVSDEDFEKLRTIGRTLSRIPEPVGGAELTKRDKRAGIVADIHTDAVNLKVLYEATGKPYVIFVAVKDANGTRLTRGAAYSHYEFVGSADERLSDEDWQAKVYEGEGEIPPVDAWTLDIIR